MTCIVGCRDNDGTIVMGGDCAGTNTLPRKDPKVGFNRQTKGVLIGFTSSYRMGQLLLYHLVPPPLETDDVFAYMVGPFISAVRTCLREGGFLQKKDDREQGGCFLVAVHGELFCIQDDLQVEQVHLPYLCVGSGAEVAMGSLYSTQTLDLPAVRRVELALESAAFFANGVRAPFVMERLAAPERNHLDA